MNPQSASFDPATLDWDKQGGLLPAIVQDAATLRVLMLGYMDRGALEATLAEGRVSFFSRSRGMRWRKGDTSGHWLEVVDVHADCDRDTLLVLARAHGSTCHLDRCSCFGDAPGDVLAELDAVVADRAQAPRGRYTDRLLAAPVTCRRCSMAISIPKSGPSASRAATSGLRKRWTRRPPTSCSCPTWSPNSTRRATRGCARCC